MPAAVEALCRHDVLSWEVLRSRHLAAWVCEGLPAPAGGAVPTDQPVSDLLRALRQAAGRRRVTEGTGNSGA
jgi:hypothetical protein